jgi:potassium channel subfamily K, other eukaryote
LTKIFTIFYILTGFFIIGFTFAYIVEIIFEKEDEFFRSKMEKRTYSKKKLTFYKLVLIFIIYLICFVAGVLTYWLGEQWSFVDALYYTIVTSTDLGETELHPTKIWTKIIATILVLSTAILFSFTIGTVAEFVAEKFKQDIADKYFNQKISVASLTDMDANQDGKVTRLEFLEYMLVKCEMVDEEDIAKIHERFEVLDADDSGYLNLDDAQVI